MIRQEMAHVKFVVKETLYSDIIVPKKGSGNADNIARAVRREKII